MGKSESEGNALFLKDDAATIRKKIMRAVTDSGPTEPNSAKPEAIENLFSLMKLVSSSDTISHFETAYNNCNIRYGDLKKQLAEDMVTFMAPITQKILDIEKNHDYVKKVVLLGREKAKASAQKTIEEVRQIIGIRRF
jgi:tryptophanyl-tRNA synthetase